MQVQRDMMENSGHCRPGEESNGIYRPRLVTVAADLKVSGHCRHTPDRRMPFSVYSCTLRIDLQFQRNKYYFCGIFYTTFKRVFLGNGRRLICFAYEKALKYTNSVWREVNETITRLQWLHSCSVPMQVQHFFCAQKAPFDKYNIHAQLVSYI